MHNWRLLLLAFLAVLEPITSFTQRNLVDGGEQCCDRDSVLRDSNLAYGTRFTKIPEDRRLSREIREDRRYEVRSENPVLNRASADRHLIEFRSERDVRRSSAEPNRLVRAEIRRESGTDNRRERLSASYDNRERRISSQNMREREMARMRYSREDIRQQHRESSRSSTARASHEDSRFTRNLGTDDRFRASMESWREARRNRDNPAERRVQETRKTRDVLQRTRTDVARDESNVARQDRRMARERMEERQSRSESRLQLDNNRVRRSLERRVRETVEDRRSRSTDRVRDLKEESRLRRDTQDERRIDHHRKISERLYERHNNMQRDQRREYRQGSMSERREFSDRSERTSRVSRDSNGGSRIDFRNNHLERHAREEERGVSRREQRGASENRRESRRAIEMKYVNRDTERKDHRTADRIIEQSRDNRRDVRLIRILSLEARDRRASPSREYRLAKLMERDTRFRSNPEFISRRENVAAIEKIPDEKPSTINWQYVFYTLQGIYLCGILTQMLAEQGSGKKSRALSWLSDPRSLVKLD